MAYISKLYSEIANFCDEVIAGRREEARALIPGMQPAMGVEQAKLFRALERLLDSVEERETKLTDLVAELASLRADQENRAEKLTRENSDLRAELHGGFKQAAALTRNPAMRLVFKQAARVASVPAPVLITGETGTGKGIVAKYIHYSGSRAKFPLVGLNCAAIPASLLESELFGIEKGVASGVSERMGHFESASNGTLFLDEIGDMPLECQAKILKAIEEGSITRVGGRKPLPVDARLISATHRELEASSAKGEFRRDLFYRLQVVHIHIPPLRERPEDILPLAAHFLRAAASRYALTVPAFAPESLRLLEGYAWPGNVRELEHEMERAALLAAGPLIQPGDLSRSLAASRPSSRAAAVGTTGTASASRPESGAEGWAGNLAGRLSAHPDLLRNIIRRMITHSVKAAPFEFAAAREADRLGPQQTWGPLGEQGSPRDVKKHQEASVSALATGGGGTALPSLFEAERELVRKVLDACGGNKTHAATRLGLSREGLRKKLKRLGLP
jgi:DNA-binding NtrC family response regulator